MYTINLGMAAKCIIKELITYTGKQHSSTDVRLTSMSQQLLEPLLEQRKRSQE